MSVHETNKKKYEKKIPAPITPTIIAP
jgi:hypothetical protein